MTPKKMVKLVLAATSKWNYSVISMGYPGPVLHERPMLEPHNLGKGWVKFNFRKAFGHPVKVITMDDGGSPATSLTDVQKMVTQDHIVVLLDNTD